MLPDVGVEGQQRIIDSTVLIMGVGGLGSPVALYLAAAGVGHLILCDFDTVELSNLQRQIIHGTPDIGKLKTESAQDALETINPSIKVTTVTEQLTANTILPWVNQADLVLEGTDNFESRFITNQACVDTHTPFISAAVSRFEGQLMAFENTKDSACLRCVFPELPEEAQTCSENGILAPVAGLMGSLQATQALKILVGLDPQYQTLMLLDAKIMDLRKLKLRKDQNCPACQQG